MLNPGASASRPSPGLLSSERLRLHELTIHTYHFTNLVLRMATALGIRTSPERCLSLRLQRALEFMSLMLCASSISLGVVMVNSGSVSEKPKQVPYSQLLVDLQNPVSVLFVALRPGMEDLAGVAYFRFGRGSKVTVLYLTNGESVPNDCGDETIRLTAARRKEEASKCVGMLESEAYFVNVTDPGVVSSRIQIDAGWKADSVAPRLEAAMARVQPDLIVLNGGEEEDSSAITLRAVLGDLVMDTKRNLLRPSPVADTRRIAPAFAQRVFENVPPSKDRRLQEQLFSTQEWPSKYRDFGASAGKAYASLRLQLPRWQPLIRTYRLIDNRGKKRPGSFDSGLVVVPKNLRLISSRIQSLCTAVKKGADSTSLRLLHTISELTSREIVNGQKSNTRHESSLLGRWKNLLEELRCRLLGISVEYTISDTVVTNRQQFSFDINSVSSKTATGSTIAYFPRDPGEQWVINNSESQRFPFEAPKTFQMLTPERMTLTTPVGEYGLALSKITKDFIFAVIHIDAERAKSYIFQRSIPLNIAPRHALELLDDVVRIVPNERLTFRAINFTHDGVGGRVFIQDSIGSAEERKFSLPGKGSQVIDTLFLQWNQQIPDGDYQLAVEISGRARKTFTARKFTCIADTVKRVGIVLAGDKSVLPAALRRLGIAPFVLDLPLAISALSAYNVVIIDREAFSLHRAPASARAQLLQWTMEGGHLIVLPQFASMDVLDSASKEIRFVVGSPVDTGENLFADSRSTLLFSPNALRDEDWQGWHFAKAFGTINVSKDSDFSADLKNHEGKPVVVSRHFQKGKISLVALNMNTQLMQVVPGAYRLLANLISF